MPRNKIDRRRRRGGGRSVVATAEAVADIDEDKNEEKDEEVGSDNGESSDDYEEPDKSDDEDFKLSENGSSDNDDDDDDFESDEEIKPKPKRRGRKSLTISNKKRGNNSASRKQPKRRYQIDEEESDNDDQDESDKSDDEDFQPQSDSDQGSVDDDDDDDSEYEEEKKAKTGRIRKKKSAQAAKSTPRRASSRGRQSRRTRSSNRSSSGRRDDDEGNVKTPDSGRRLTPARASANRANQKLIETLQSDTEENSSNIRIYKSRRKKGKNDDEEEYVESEDDELEDDSDVDFDDEGEDYIEDENEDNKHIQNVDDEDIGSIDSDNDNAKPLSSPRLDIHITPTKRRKVIVDESSSDEAEGTFSDDDNVSDDIKPLPSPKRLPQCPSNTDSVTEEPLPCIHVCCIMPDYRYCYALETLHKVSTTRNKDTFLQPPAFRSTMSDDLLDQIVSRFGRAALDINGDFYKRKANSSHDDMDEDDESGYQVHFSESLYNNNFFNDRLNNYMTNLMGSRDIYCCPLCYTESHNRYLTGDDDPDDDDDDENGNNDQEETPATDKYIFTQDPMGILGYLDNDVFELASTFCFTKMSQVKQHLRSAHNMDPSTIGDNEFYKRFKIRESDGLLQRYIEKLHKKRRIAYQGEMSRYWNMGANQMFIELLQLIERTQRLINSTNNGDEEESENGGDGSSILEKANYFFQSFQNRAKRTWERLTYPYRKVTKDDLKDFIANDEESDGGNEGDDQVPVPMFQQPLSADSGKTPEELIVEELRKKRRRNAADSGLSISSSDDNNNDELESSSSDDDDELEIVDELNNSNDGGGDDDDDDVIGSGILNHPAYYSEEEKEEDEWEKNIRARKGRRSNNKSLPSATKVDVGTTRKQLASGKKKFQQSSATIKSPPTTISSTPMANLQLGSPTKKPRRRVIESSDDDDDD